MKKSYFLIFSTLLFFYKSNAQLFHLQWTNKQNSSNTISNNVMQFATDAQGNSFSINRTQDASSLYYVNRFISYDINGNIKWENKTDSCNNCTEIYNCIVPLNNGDVIFVGYNNTSTNDWNVILKKYLSNGTLAWDKYILNKHQAKTIKALKDYNNDIVIALDAKDSNNYNNHTILKCSGIDGSSIWWNNIFEGIYSANQTITDIDIDKSNSVFLVGKYIASNLKYYEILKLDSSGNFINELPLFNTNSINTILNTPKVKVDNLGYVYTFYNDLSMGYCKKFDDSLLNSFQNISIQQDSATSQIVDVNFINKNFYILSNANYRVLDASVQGFYKTNKTYFIQKLDTAYNSIWQKKYFNNFDKGSNNADFGGALQITNCGTMLWVSSIQNKTDNNPYLLLNKLDLNGTQLWYDSNKIDVGQHYFIATDANCNGYTNYEAFDDITKLHGIVKKYTDNLNFPQLLTDEIKPNINVQYLQSGVEVNIANENIMQYQLLNIIGMTVATKENNGNTVFVNNYQYPQGIYILVLQTKQGLLTQKIQLY